MLAWQGETLRFEFAVELNGRLATNVHYELSGDRRTLTAREKVRGLGMDHDNVWVLARVEDLPVA